MTKDDVLKYYKKKYSNILTNLLRKELLIPKDK